MTDFVEARLYISNKGYGMYLCDNFIMKISDDSDTIIWQYDPSIYLRIYHVDATAQTFEHEFMLPEYHEGSPETLLQAMLETVVWQTER